LDSSLSHRHHWQAPGNTPAVSEGNILPGRDYNHQGSSPSAAWIDFPAVPATLIYDTRYDAPNRRFRQLIETG